MDSILEKSKDTSRGLLFELLGNCIFSTGASENCPLSKLRINLTTEDKYEYVMGLSDREINNILAQHECCYEKRFSNLHK